MQPEFEEVLHAKLLNNPAAPDLVPMAMSLVNDGVLSVVFFLEFNVTTMGEEFTLDGEATDMVLALAPDAVSVKLQLSELHLVTLPVLGEVSVPEALGARWVEHLLVVMMVVPVVLLLAGVLWLHEFLLRRRIEAWLRHKLRHEGWRSGREVSLQDELAGWPAFIFYRKVVASAPIEAKS